MKKVLFATTALIATAGVASAEVAVSGWAEMGVQQASVDNAATTTVNEKKMRLFQDFNVKFSMSGTTDGGLTFGANVELRDTLSYTNPGDDNGTDIYIKGGFGALTMGNTDGAMDWALTEVGIGGSIADNNTAHAGYMGDYGDGEYNGQVVRYDNSFGDIGFAVSTELQNATAANSPGGNGKSGFAIGGKYTMDMGGTAVNLGVGYQTFVQKTAVTAGGGNWRGGWAAGDNITMTGFSVNADFNGVIAKLEYTDIRNSTTANVNVKHTGVGLGYAMNGLTVGANWGRFDAVNAADDNTGFGLAVDYDLGGGAIVQAGYGSSKVGTAASTSNMSLGLRLNF